MATQENQARKTHSPKVTVKKDKYGNFKIFYNGKQIADICPSLETMYLIAGRNIRIEMQTLGIDTGRVTHKTASRSGYWIEWEKKVEF